MNGCGLFTAGLCRASSAGVACPAIRLPCGPKTRAALGRRIRRRLLHAFRNMHRATLHVVGEGHSVTAFWPSATDEEHLIAEALAWLRLYVLNPDTVTPRLKREKEALVLWLRTQNHMVGGSAHSILLERARARGRSVAAVLREFFRLVASAVRRIKVGLVNAGVYVHEAPQAHALPNRTCWRDQIQAAA